MSWQVWYRETKRHAWRLAGYAGSREAALDWARGLHNDRDWQTFYGTGEPEDGRVQGASRAVNQRVTA